jgi:hypothetical protein
MTALGKKTKVALNKYLQSFQEHSNQISHRHASSAAHIVINICPAGSAVPGTLLGRVTK